jgi:inosine/guanosine/xanthosine phosphorylase family protein
VAHPAQRDKPAVSPISKSAGSRPREGLADWGSRETGDPDDFAPAAERLLRAAPFRTALAVVLGSGFEPFRYELECVREISYDDLPGWPSTTVRGHAGTAIFGRLSGTPVLVLNGRAHFYEGHSMGRVVLPIRSLAAMGVRDLLLTNAAGGIDPRLKPGTFMMLNDHINLMGANPLRGSGSGALRFVDLSDTYDADLRELMQRAAVEMKVPLRAGVYLAVSGPSYETPAEIRAFARLGADAVGMSTVPEAIAARQCGMRVAAVSCITNAAAGRHRGPLSHAEVLAAADNVKVHAARLLKRFVELYHSDSTREADGAPKICFEKRHRKRKLRP